MLGGVALTSEHLVRRLLLALAAALLACATTAVDGIVVVLRVIHGCLRHKCDRLNSPTLARTA